GQRIVMLKGRGDFFEADKDGKFRFVKGATNIVSILKRIDGNRIWLEAPSGRLGWVNKDEVILLTEAIQYFSSLIEQNSTDWDAYLRRADSKHALNQREAAIEDYTKAIQLHPSDAFLYLRRARSFNTLKAYDKALSDFDEVIRLEPTSAEPYSIKASIYANCPDVRYRNPE